MPVETPTDRWRRLDLKLAADAYEGRPIDTTTVDASIREDPDQPPQEVAVHLAYHKALVEVDGGRDGLPPLLAARASMGHLTPDLARRLWVARFRYAVVSFLAGAWLLVAILVTWRLRAESSGSSGKLPGTRSTRPPSRVLRDWP